MKKPEDEYSMSKKGTALEEGEALVKNNCRSTVTGSYTACRVQRYIDKRVMLNLSFLLKGANQARSFDIRESHSGTSDRPPVSKSFSFGGYPAPQVRESNQVSMAIGVLIFFKNFSASGAKARSRRLWSQL